MNHVCDSSCQPTITDHGDGITETYSPHGGAHIFRMPAAVTRDGVTISTHPSSYYVTTRYTRLDDPYRPLQYETTVNGWSGEDSMRKYALHALRAVVSRLN
ncbi:hypothetical protein ETD86_37380 [Nonomuraea turkmeniaca]|uniref:Uncharacterized protein n=1 Tax=Nonomuraea turkmeniaca TaxID=103838 RepID=A0A5S4F4T1_9ACTN|nr:hypothetical protein [Nonomuraea turkmeniaca]TMR10991.1 hypothetical protein ETD86_37380 [Nonomuraea turkmeniaca]